MRLLRRMPAVSTKRSQPSSVSTTVSMVSRVVPGASCTTARSSPTRRLNRVDLPTLGRPTMATENGFPASRAPPARQIGPIVGPPRLGASSGSGGSCSTMMSSSSPLPRPCSADTGIGSPSPSRVKSQASDSRLASSTLFTASSTGLATAAARRNQRVLLGDPDRAVDHHDHEVGLVDGPFGLEADLAGQRFVGADPPAGVDDQEGPPDPFRLDHLAVPGDPGLFLDDRLPAPDDPVHQRALAHVGPPDDAPTDWRLAVFVVTARGLHQGVAAGADDLDGRGRSAGPSRRGTRPGTG